MGCRGPLLAASLAQVPQRERPLAVTMSAMLFNTESSDSIDIEVSDNAALCLRTNFGYPADCASSNCSIQVARVQLRRALTSPMDACSEKPQVLVRRSATSLLEALGGGCDN